MTRDIAGWIAYADTSAMICAIGDTEQEVIDRTKAIGADPSGEEYAWICTAPATARLLADTDADWRLFDGVADIKASWRD